MTKPAAIAQEHGPERPLVGATAILASALAAALSALALYWTQFPIGTMTYRAAFLGLVLALIFVLYPMRSGAPVRGRATLADLALILLAVAALAYLVFEAEALKTRATRPWTIEVLLGTGLIFCVLEATRRTAGWVLPAVAIAFLIYAYAGPFMPEPLDHRGYSISRIIGHNYLTLEGIFSTPLDVAATFIILFTIYGAVLDKSGAGPFFIDWAFAAFGRKPSAAAPGRAVVASGFLLGSVSGSGVATTVTLASLSWPLLQRAGYPANVASGLLSAAGIGALISPPTLGAAAFIIAEYLEISYAQVLLMALIPTVLYYVSSWGMLEADARRMALKPVSASTQTIRELTFSRGYHFLSLFAIAGLLMTGMSAFRAVFWSVVIAFALSLLRAETQLVPVRAAGLGFALALILYLATGLRLPEAALLGLALSLAVAGLEIVRARLNARTIPALPRLFDALVSGAKGAAGVAATCATAGVIVSVITLTGLGLKISGLIVDAGQGNLFATILMAAIAMWVLGAAVPVTASYIIGAVTLAPALTDAGVAPAAAHMFLFYYAVLGDVSPPTALAPFAAAAITRGSPLGAMLHAWRYCLPAFVAPFMFCLTPEGLGLLGLGSFDVVALGFVTAVFGVAALASGIGGWIFGPSLMSERIVMAAGGLALFYADWAADVLGAMLVTLTLIFHALRGRT